MGRLWINARCIVMRIAHRQAWIVESMARRKSLAMLCMLLFPAQHPETLCSNALDIVPLVLVCT